MVVKDSVIVKVLQENCNKGGSLLFERYYRPLVLFADSLIKDRVYAEDLVQDIFYRFMKEPRRLFKRYFVTNSKFLWYLFRDKGEK